MPLGANAHFGLIGHLTDGSRRDVTNEARWSAVSQELVSFSAPGIATGRERGETYVNAQLQWHQGSRQVMVSPAGTYNSRDE